MTGFTVGGKNAWKVVSRGEVAAAFHWIQDEPSVVIFPTMRQMAMIGAMPYVMPLSAAHDLVMEGTGGTTVDAEALVAKARKAAEVIGYDGDWAVVRKIADLLLDCLDDLCRMPPKPAILGPDQKPIGDIALKVDGQTVYEGEE